MLYSNAGCMKISQCARASFSQSQINLNRIIFTTTAILKLSNAAKATIDRACLGDGDAKQGGIHIKTKGYFNL
jgi:hypothetical protein